MNDPGEARLVVENAEARYGDLEDDEHLDVCQNIEAGLKQVYEHHADLTDAICLFALENAKIAIRKHCGFAKNASVTDHPLAKNIVEWCAAIGVERIGKVNNLTLPECIARIEKSGVRSRDIPSTARGDTMSSFAISCSALAGVSERERDQPLHWTACLRWIRVAAKEGPATMWAASV